MRKGKVLFTIGLLGALSFTLFLACDQKVDVTSVPGSEPIEITLKAVIELDWDRNLLEVPSIFPGGHLIRGDVKRKRLACYRVASKFTDIKAEGNLWFHQSEKGIQNRAEKHVTLKKVVISNASPDEQDRRFDEICAYIKGMHQHVFTTLNPVRCDAEFTIDPLSRDKYPIISITKNYPSANTLDLAIQQVKRVKGSHLTNKVRLCEERTTI